MSRLFDYFYILATIAFTVYGQLMLKWRIERFGAVAVPGYRDLFRLCCWVPGIAGMDGGDDQI
jgi:hypothetical protein